MTVIQGIGWVALGMAMGFTPSTLAADAPHPVPVVQVSIWRPLPNDPEPTDPEPHIVELCIPEVVQIST